MAANAIPLILREEEVNLADGTFDIPDGVIGAVIQMRAGANDGMSNISFFNPSLTIACGMYRGGGGGHHYETSNCYNIFLPDRDSDLLPRQVTLSKSGSSDTRIIRWIYVL